MSPLPQLGLEPVDVAVGASASFGEAARRLAASGLPSIAVVDEQRSVVGLFGEDELLRGIFPRYLGELRHTAFTFDDVAALAERFASVVEEPVSRHSRAPLVVDVETSATHVAELLLHHENTAIAVVREGRYEGMITERDFARALLRLCGLDAPGA